MSNFDLGLPKFIIMKVFVLDNLQFKSIVSIYIYILKIIFYLKCALCGTYAFVSLLTHDIETCWALKLWSNNYHLINFINYNCNLLLPVAYIFIFMNNNSIINPRDRALFLKLPQEISIILDRFFVKPTIDKHNNTNSNQ